MKVEGKLREVSPTLIEQVGDSGRKTKYQLDDCKFYFKLSDLKPFQVHSVHDIGLSFRLGEKVFEDKLDFFREFLSDEVEPETETNNFIRAVGQDVDGFHRRLHIIKKSDENFEAIPVVEVLINIRSGKPMPGDDQSIWPKGVYYGSAGAESGGYEFDELTGRLDISIRISEQQFQELNKAYRDDFVFSIGVGVTLLAYQEQNLHPDYSMTPVLIKSDGFTPVITDFIRVDYQNSNLSVEEDSEETESKKPGQQVVTFDKSVIANLSHAIGKLVFPIWILVIFIIAKSFW